MFLTGWYDHLRHDIPGRNETVLMRRHARGLLRECDMDDHDDHRVLPLREQANYLISMAAHVELRELFAQRTRAVLSGSSVFEAMDEHIHFPIPYTYLP